jgi:hypothetical protein
MQCRDITHRLIELLDGTIHENDRRRSIEAHLATCQACRQEFEALRKTLGLVEQAGAIVSPGEQFWVNYLPQVRARMMERRRMRHVLPVWVGGTAVVLLALVIGVQEVRRTMTTFRQGTGQATAVVEDTSTAKEQRVIGGDAGEVTTGKTPTGEDTGSREGASVDVSTARVTGRGNVGSRRGTPAVVEGGGDGKQSSDTSVGALDDLVTTESSGRDEETGLTDEEFHEMESAFEAYQIEYGDLDLLVDDLSTEEWEEFYKRVGWITNS